MTTQHFDAARWAGIGLNTQQVRYLDELTRKLNSVENGATGDQSTDEIVSAYNSAVSVVTQAVAEAGTSTDVYRWTPERVNQSATQAALAVQDDTLIWLGV